MKLNTFYKQGAALALCLTLSFPVFAEKDLVQYVNTLQGTNSTYELSWGNTYPTTAVPYPMNSWSWLEIPILGHYDPGFPTDASM